MLVNNGHVDEGLLAGLENIANNGSDYEGVPQAYLNYIVFDKDHNVIEGKKLQISEAGKFTVGNETTGDHEHLQIDPITISEEGYVYIYLSNQTPNSEVYFDDLYIKHTKSRVIQKNDYYPFGMDIQALSAQRDKVLLNRYKYNGKEHQVEFGLEWYDYGARMYEPSIGRWNHVDPKADKYPSANPYNYCFNNPINLVDPDGMDPNSDDEDDEKSDEDKLIEYYQNLGYKVNSIESVKEVVNTIYKVNSVLSDHDEESTFTQIISSENSKRFQMVEAIVNFWVPTGDRINIIAGTELLYNAYEGLDLKFSPEKLPKYKSSLERVEEKLKGRIKKTVKEAISIAEYMSYYDSNESKKSLTYQYNRAQWERLERNLYKKQDDLQLIKHEIRRVEELIYENPVYYK